MLERKIKAERCFLSIAGQLLAKENHKFQYKLLEKGGKAAKYFSSIDWLTRADIATQSTNVAAAAYDELFEKRLLLLLPYYLMRYEKALGEIAADDVRTAQLIAECSELRTGLELLTLSDGESFCKSHDGIANANHHVRGFNDGAYSGCVCAKPK